MGKERAQKPRLGRAVLAWAILIAALTAATLVLLSWVPRDVPAFPARALLPADAQERALWTIEKGRNAAAEISADRLVLRAEPEDPFVLAHRPLELAENARGVRLEGEVRFLGRARDKSFEAARIHLWAFDAAGQRLPDRRIDLFRARADRDWQRVRADLPLPPAAAAAHLVVRLQGTAGMLEVRRLEAAALIPNPVLEAARLGLGAGWLVGLLAAAALVWRAAARRSHALLALIASAGGIFLILVPPEAFALLPAGLGQTLQHASSTPFLPHALLAAMLAFLLGRTVPRARLVPALGLVLLLAVAGEVLQLLSNGRQPAVDDAFANALGGLVGLVLARFRTRRMGACEAVRAQRVDLGALPLAPFTETQDSSSSRAP